MNPDLTKSGPFGIDAGNRTPELAVYHCRHTTFQFENRIPGRQVTGAPS